MDVIGPLRGLQGLVDDDAALGTLFRDPYPNPDRLASRNLPEVSGGWGEARLAVVGALLDLAADD